METNPLATTPGSGNALSGRKPGEGDCWNYIGVSGDQSCPELKTFIHCRNCHVFAAAARTFFDRPAPEGYLAGWSRWLMGSAEQDARVEGNGDEQNGTQFHGESVSLLIFRLGAEWLAFRAHTVAEVTNPRPVHYVPHRSNETFVGLVNLQGQVQLCVSLHGLLGVTAPSAPTRLIVLRDGDKGETWAFPADEVLGVESVPRNRLRGVPSTLANPTVGFSQAVLSWNERSIGLIDEQRVFATLRSLGA
jgi:chemotaxis-related protein WspD